MRCVNVLKPQHGMSLHPWGPYPSTILADQVSTGLHVYKLSSGRQARGGRPRVREKYVPDAVRHRKTRPSASKDTPYTCISSLPCLQKTICVHATADSMYASSDNVFNGAITGVCKETESLSQSCQNTRRIRSSAMLPRPSPGLSRWYRNNR